MPLIPLNRSNKFAITLFCTVLFTIEQVQAQCSASGPRNPGAAIDSAYPGSNFAFSSPTNSFTSNNSYASAGSIASLISGQTDYLKVSNFGFTIPTSATICGIQVDVEKNASNLLGLGTITDDHARIMQGATAGNDLADAVTQWSTTNGYVTYGGSTELWGLSWTAADINSNNFGFIFSANINGFFNGIITVLPVARIDNIRITVYYNVVLPIQLVKFNVSGNKYNNALLQWQTGVQNEPVRFAIQRSPNGSIWETLPGAVQSDAAGELYTFTDIKPLPGPSLYRLKMTTAPGVDSYSESKIFLSAADNLVKYYPSPATSYIKISGVRPGEKIQLTDITGHRIPIANAVVNSNPFTVDISHLQPGSYFIIAGNTTMKIQKK